MLTIDPWSEDGHRLVVEGRLARGDLDGARRALLEAISVLDDLGVAPGMALVLLGYRQSDSAALVPLQQAFVSRSGYPGGTASIRP